MPLEVANRQAAYQSKFDSYVLLQLGGAMGGHNSESLFLLIKFKLDAFYFEI